MDKELILEIIRIVCQIGLCYMFYHEGYEKGHDKGWQDYRNWFYGKDEKEKK